jgi:hypothetical protein
MAARTARLAVVERPARLGVLRDRAHVAARKPVERSIEKDQRALERSERTTDVVVVDAAAVRRLERSLILGVVRDRSSGRSPVGHAHLDRVDDRKLRLVLEGGCSTVPKLAREERGVQRRWGVALADLVTNTLGGVATIAEAAIHVVAGCARNSAVLGQARLEIQLATEGHALRRAQVVRWDERLPVLGIDPRRSAAARGIQLERIELLLLCVHRGRAVRALPRAGDRWRAVRRLLRSGCFGRPLHRWRRCWRHRRGCSRRLGCLCLRLLWLRCRCRSGWRRRRRSRCGLRRLHGRGRLSIHRSRGTDEQQRSGECDARATRPSCKRPGHGSLVRMSRSRAVSAEARRIGNSLACMGR